MGNSVQLCAQEEKENNLMKNQSFSTVEMNKQGDKSVPHPQSDLH